MNTDLLLVVLLLLAAIVMFLINKPRMDVVALIMMAALPLTGVITMGEALAGFSDSNIVLIAALFVIGDGLVRTGVARGLGDLLIAKTGNCEIKLVVFLMIASCALGSLMSSTAVVAIFIPVVLRVAYSSGAAPSKLMMPLSFAALISGMMTLVATAPNLVVSSELMRQGHEGFSFFAFTPFGIPILILGIFYMLFARRWLPEGEKSVGEISRKASLADWIDRYDLSSREFRLRVMEGSPLAGSSIAQLDLRGSDGANIIAIERSGRFSRELIYPTSKTILEAGDIILIDMVSGEQSVEALQEKFQLQRLPLGGTYFNDRTQEIGMAQLMVPDESRLLGKTVVEAQLRSKAGLTVIGLRRGSEIFGKDLTNEPLRIGDTLLVVGSWNKIEQVSPEETGLLILSMPIEVEEVLPAAGKAPQALACLFLVVVLMVSGIVTNVHAALIGCLLMGLLGCINMNSSYRSIGWKTLVLIVGMLPFSLALQRTGGVDIAVDVLMAMAGNMGTHGILATLFALTAVLSMFMSNTATAVLLAPVAIGVAYELEASPFPFAMIVALAASTAFVTPVSSPVNTLVVTPGNYSFGDFVKVGGPFALITMIVCVILVPIILPL